MHGCLIIWSGAKTQLSSRRVYFKGRIAWEAVQASALIEYVLYDVLLRIYVNANRKKNAKTI